MNRVKATGTVIRIPVMKILRRRRLRLLNMMVKVGEWGLRFKCDALSAEPQDRANRCAGVGVSNYYIGIYGEGKWKGRGAGV